MRRSATRSRQTQRAGAAANAASGGYNSAQVGLGVTLGSIDNLMAPARSSRPGSSLDVAIQGDGWFRLGHGHPGRRHAERRHPGRQHA